MTADGQTLHDLPEDTWHSEPQKLDHAMALTARSIRHSFLRGDSPVEVLDDVDLTIGAGEFVALVGPSGCGKTTLLNMFAGLLTPEQGSILFDDEPGDPQDIAYMLATDALLPWRTASKNVQLALRIQGMPKSESQERSREWLHKVGLGDAEHVNVQQLSHGMRQRVAIARTLVQTPQAILMDEPFAALDAQTRITVQEQFLSLWERERATVVLVTHDLAEAILLADRIVLISKAPGQVVADISIELPRPRAPERDRRSEKFFAQYDELWQLLRQEFDT